MYSQLCEPGWTGSNNILSTTLYQTYQRSFSLLSSYAAQSQNISSRVALSFKMKGEAKISSKGWRKDFHIGIFKCFFFQRFILLHFSKSKWVLKAKSRQKSCLEKHSGLYSAIIILSWISAENRKAQKPYPAITIYVCINICTEHSKIVDISVLIYIYTLF